MIHDHDGAQITRSGTGTPNSQPATSTCFRPKRSPRRPARRFVSAFTTPNVAMNESAALRDTIPKSRSAMSGRTVRSSPTIAPTNALTATNSQNCRQLARRPRAIGRSIVRRSALVTIGNDLDDGGTELHRCATADEHGEEATARQRRESLGLSALHVAACEPVQLERGRGVLTQRT